MPNEQTTILDIQKALNEMLEHHDKEVPDIEILDWQFIAIGKNTKGKICVIGANPQGDGQEGLKASERMKTSAYLHNHTSITRPFLIDICSRIFHAWNKSVNNVVTQMKKNAVHGAPPPNMN